MARANIENIGNWNGQESLAVTQFNVIHDEIERLIEDCADEYTGGIDLVHEASNRAFELVCDSDALLTMTRDELLAIAARVAS